MKRLSIAGGQFNVKSLRQACIVMPKFTRILLVIVKVDECGTNLFYKMLLQEDMHQVAGMNTLILNAIWQVLRIKQQNELFSTKGLLCGGNQRLKGVCFVRNM